MAVAVTKEPGFEKFLKDANPADIEKYKNEQDDDDDSPDGDWPEENEKTKPNQYTNEEDMYGYGDAAPTPRTNRAPRRSSMKSGTSSGIPRRASIGYTGEMVLVLPTGKQAKKKTSISFADESNNTINHVDSVCNLVDNPNRLWFQQEEYSHIKAKIISIAERSKKGERTTWLCARGLESILDSSSSYERAEAYESVMDEQRMQKAQGRWDDNYIREVYEFSTIDAKVRAAQRAEEDAKSVEKYLDITKKMCRRLSC